MGRRRSWPRSSSESTPRRGCVRSSSSRSFSVLDGGGLRITDRKVEELAEAIRTLPDLRFRGEAIVQTAIVRSAGTRDQRERAEEALRGAAARKDPVQAALVRWAQESSFSKSDLLKMAGVE